MAVDGLLPPIFSQVDKDGNLRNGILISGALTVIIAILVPFDYLNDMISAGVMFSFNLTNTSLILLRRKAPETAPVWQQCPFLLTVLNVVCFTACMLLTYVDLLSAALVAPLALIVVVICIGNFIVWKCPERADPHAASQYRVPFVPWMPIIAIFLNYFLIAQLTVWGLLLIFGYLGLGIVLYFCYGFHYSTSIKGSQLSTKSRPDDTPPLHSLEMSDSPVHSS